MIPFIVFINICQFITRVGNWNLSLEYNEHIFNKSIKVALHLTLVNNKKSCEKKFLLTTKE